MKQLLCLIFCIISTVGLAQSPFNAGWFYTTTPTTGAPSTNGTRFRVDLATQYIYQWNPTELLWQRLGQGIDVFASVSDPAYTPTANMSWFVVNTSNKLFRYSGAGTVWNCINCDEVTFSGDLSGNALSQTVIGIQNFPVSAVAPGSGEVLKWNGVEWAPATDAGTTYTGGSGIDITGTVITNIGDLSTTNEIQVLTAGDGIGDNKTLDLSLSGGAVTLDPSGILTISRTGNTLVLTATEVDGSTTNEVQSYGHSGTTSYTNTLSLGGGSFTLQASGIATISHTAGTVMISATEVDGSISNEGSLTVDAGTGTTSIINSNTSGQTGVTLTAAGILAISEVGNTITLTATEVDGSTTNEVQSYAHSGTTSYTNTLSLGGGAFTLQAAGITSISHTAGTVTITSTEVDGSTTNEVQSYAHSGTTSYTNTLSLGGGSFTLQASGIASISHTAGTVTVSATEVDGSISNEGSLTVAAGTGTTSIINSNTSGQTGVTLTAAGILAISETGNNITLTATEVDGSISNEGSLTVAAGTGTTSIINSNTSGQTGVTLTAAGILAISETGNNITLTATEVDGSLSNEGSLTVLAGSGTTSVISSNTSGSSNVTFTAAGILAISETGNTITLTATEAQTLSYTVSSGALSISSGNSVTIPVFTGATASVNGEQGLVPKPLAGEENKFLQGNGTWGNPTVGGDNWGSQVVQHGSTLSGDGTSGTPLNVATGGITANEIALNAVENAEMADNAVGSSEVADNTLTASDLAVNVVSSVDGVTNDGGNIDLIAGSNITLTPDDVNNNITIAASFTEVDGSISNEGSLTVLAGSGTTSVISSNTSGSSDVTLTAAGIISISETGNTITLTGTEVDGSTTNEVQTLTAGDGVGDNKTLDLSLSGGTVTLDPAGILTISRSTNTLTLTATEVDGSTTNEGSLTVLVGTGTTSVISSNTSGSSDVTLTAAGILAISETGNTITLTATEVDGSTTNEVQSYGHSGTTSYTNTLSLGGGSFTLQASGIASISHTAGTVTISATEVDGSTTNEAFTIDADDADTEVISNQTVKFQGAGITTTDYNPATDVLLITSTEIDGSTSNEIQSYGHSGTTSYTNTLSLGGGSFTLQASGIATISHTAGTVTISATEVDGSTSNEIQSFSHSGTTSYTNTLSLGGGSFTLQSGGIVAISNSAGTVTISATEVDGSTTNEAWTIDGDDLDTEVISNQTVKFQGAGIATTDYNPTTDVLLITATEVDGSISNEGSLTVAAGTGTTSIINSNTSGQTGVTLTAAGILAISESGNNITLTATEVDGSTTNEGSLTVGAGTGTTSVISSNTSGSTDVTLSAGSNITLSEVGNTITIAASGSGSTDLTFTGASSPVTLNSSSGTDVTFTAGTNITLSATGTNITIDASGGSGAPTDAQYLTLATNTTLSAERVFTAGVNVAATDAGANGNLTVDVLSGNQTTSQFTADQDNFSPTNWSTRATHYVSSDATIRAITSFSALADGTIRRIVNTGSHPIYVPGEHPDGTAANRVITDNDVFIGQDGGVLTIFYDGVSSRWRVQSNTFSPSTPGANGMFGQYYHASAGATITGDWGDLTLVGNNDVAAATSLLLGGYSSNTSTSATGQGSLYFTDVLLNPTEFGLTHTVGSALVQITANTSTSAQRYTAQVAFVPTPSSATLAVNNSIGIRYSDNINSGKWEGFTRNNAGTESTVDLGITVAANTGYVLTICVDRANSEARFYVNGTFAGRITTNLPTSGTDYGFRVGIWKSVGTTLRDIVTPWLTFYTIKGF